MEYTGSGFYNQQLLGLLASPGINPFSAAGFIGKLNPTTNGLDISFAIADITGISSITLRRNYLNDLATATVLQTWNARVAPYVWSDTDSALQANGGAFYWLTFSPTGTSGKEMDTRPLYVSLYPTTLIPHFGGLPISASHAAAVNGTVLITVNILDQGQSLPTGSSFQIYVTGYEGNANPVAVAQQTANPLQFTLNATGETIDIYAEVINAAGIQSDRSLFATLVLNGVATVPAIIQNVSVAQLPTGNQITFPASIDSVTSYNIYRGPRGGGFSASTLLTTITATNVNTIQYLDTGGFSGDYEYFVTAVNAAGSSQPQSSGASAQFIAASSVLYIDGQAVQALQPAAQGADVTADQPIVYTGLSSNLVPNGTFILGNIKGWVGATGGGGGPVFGGGGLNLFTNTSACSPAFNVTPGQKYRLTFTGLSINGTQDVTLRISYGSAYSANIQPTGSFFDFMSGGSFLPTSETKTYDWTCPAGVHYASLAMYQTTAGTAQLLFSNISAQAFTVGVGNLGVNGSGGISGVNGAALDGSGNVMFKNIGTVQGSTGTLTGNFADLPSLGGMSYSLKGNPVLVSLNIAFQATSSGGNVTNTGFSPTTATSNGSGSGPPNVTIVISGDGGGATATVSWAGSGGPVVTYTPTVTLNGGSGYSYANAVVTVTVPAGTTYSGPGSGTYGCTVATPVPQAGVSISVRALLDGAILFDPTQGVTDANGRAKFNELQVFSIGAGSHTFAVQGKYDGSTAAKVISGLFNVIELG